MSVDIYVTDETKVQMRWDSGTPLDRVWQASKDNTALFAPEPNEILDSLLVHRRLVFRYFPYSENPQTATFILPPLTSRETSLKTHCGFSPAAELAGIAAEVASVELTPARDRIEIAEADRVLGRTLVKRVKNRKGQVLTSYVLEFRIDHPDDGRSLSFEGDTLPLDKGANRVTVIVNGVAAVRVLTYVVK